MKTLGTVALAFCLASFASSAQAVGGIDLSLDACPDNAGAIASTTVDCAAGGTLTILATWAPAQAIPDLVGIDALLKLAVGGDLNSNAGFWNFDPASGLSFPCDPNRLSTSQLRPPTGCDAPDYLDAWNANGSLGQIACGDRAPILEEIAFACARPSPLSVVAGQRVFGAQILIDLTIPDGTCPGCTLPVCINWFAAHPASNGAVSPDELRAPTGYGAAQGISNLLTFNGGTGLCAATPARRSTWGQLKTLYR